MTKEIVKSDKIVDFAGNEHHFVIAVVKVPLKNGKDNYPVVIDASNGYVSGETRTGLKVGIAICNPTDKFSDDMGRTKALGRAYKANPSLFSIYSGQISDDLMNMYINQEIQYIKDNPERFIKGYNEAKDRYFKHEEMQKLTESFSQAERTIVENIKKNPAYLDNIQKYIEYWKKCGKH